MQPIRHVLGAFVRAVQHDIGLIRFLEGKGPEEGRLLCAQIDHAGQSRIKVGAIGRQDDRKGFDKFAEIYAKSPELREGTLFFYAGKVAQAELHKDEAFIDAGGLGFNYFLSEDEILASYAACDFVWCAYAPRYDQASGIFGRALQLGIVPIVRAQSMIHKQCQHDEIVHVVYSEDMNGAQLLSALQAARATPEDHQDPSKWREQSVVNLYLALGLIVPDTMMRAKRAEDMWVDGRQTRGVDG
jgi:hypothetical protein